MRSSAFEQVRRETRGRARQADVKLADETARRVHQRGVSRRRLDDRRARARRIPRRRDDEQAAVAQSPRHRARERRDARSRSMRSSIKPIRTAGYTGLSFAKPSRPRRATKRIRAEVREGGRRERGRRRRHRRGAGHAARSSARSSACRSGREIRRASIPVEPDPSRRQAACARAFPRRRDPGARSRRAVLRRRR